MAKAVERLASERMSVGLIPRATADLQELLTLTGLSKTDVINRAISLYRFVSQEIANGNELLVRDGETGEVERVHLL